MLDGISFTLDGEEVIAAPGETIWQVANRKGTEIPHLCYMPKPGYRPDGNCRACMVEIEGERVLAPSCVRVPTAGMKVQTNNPRVLHSQKLVLELLQSDMPEREYTLDNELDQWSRKLDLGKPRFEPRPDVAADLSHPAIAVRLDACIQCTRCV